ncbi:MAG: enoyl-CoA hydratase/isomerase family protein [Thermoanaerobaculaceae bacterium]|nr:enoyl-CoA hydratase/isomerase family protein [Thermoanaerobaculaceae bacterium]
MSSNETVQVTARDRVRLLRLARGANALDTHLLEELLQLLAALEGEGAPAIVLTSAHPTVFCPGLDLKRLDGCQRAEVGEVMQRFSELLCRLVSYPGPTVAAITGHAIAGGCLLALGCDRRVMTRSGARIGLSEINLGIPVPAGATAMLLALYPTRSVEQLVLEGDGFGGERALELGLVERIADRDGVVEEAVRLAQHLASRPPAAFAAAKRFLRQGLAATMQERDAAELDRFLDCWFAADTQDRIGALVASM